MTAAARPEACLRLLTAALSNTDESKMISGQIAKADAREIIETSSVIQLQLHIRRLPTITDMCNTNMFYRDDSVI